MRDIKPIKTFAVGVLTRNGEYLAERRHRDEEHFGGLTVFPGGLVEEGESAEEALIREMKEELGVQIGKYSYIGEFFYEDGHRSMVYLVNRWEGEPTAKEAESIVWIKGSEELSNEFDRKILRRISELRNV